MHICKCVQIVIQRRDLPPISVPHPDVSHLHGCPSQVRVSQNPRLRIHVPSNLRSQFRSDSPQTVFAPLKLCLRQVGVFQIAALISAHLQVRTVQIALHCRFALRSVSSPLSKPSSPSNHALSPYPFNCGNCNSICATAGFPFQTLPQSSLVAPFVRNVYD